MKKEKKNISAFFWNKENGSFRRIIGLPIIFFVLLITIAYVIVQYIVVYNKTDNFTNQLVYNEADLVHDNVTSSVNTVYTDANSITTDYSVKTQDLNAYLNNFELYLDRNPLISEIGFLDTSGSGDFAVKIYDENDPTLYKISSAAGNIEITEKQKELLFDNKSAISEPMFSELSNSTVIYIYIPAYNTTNEMIGVTATSINLQLLRDQTLNKSDFGFAHLYRPDISTVFAHDQGGILIKYDEDTLAFYNKTLNVEDKTTISSDMLKYGDTFVSFKEIPRLNSYLIYTTNAVGIQDFVNSNVSSILIFTAIFSIILILGIIILISKILKPFEKLKTQLDKAAEGDISKLRGTSYKSFEEIKSKFNHMVEVVNSKELQLIEYRSDKNEMNRHKNHFISELSKDIKKPLYSMQGYSYLLSNSIGPEFKNNPYMLAIENSSKHLIHLAKEIDDYVNIDDDRFSLENIEFSTGQLLESLQKSIEQVEMSTGINVQFNIDRNLPAVMVGDPVRIEQVLFTLVTNAIKTSSTTKIILRLKLEIERDNFYKFVACITDPVRIISAEQQTEMFDSFSRYNDQISNIPSFVGTGLSLHISKCLAKKMSGDVWAKSSEESGTNYFFTFITTSPNIDSEALLTTTLNPAHKGKVVIVVEPKGKPVSYTQKSLTKIGIEAIVISPEEDITFVLDDRELSALIIDGDCDDLYGSEYINIFRSIHDENIPIIYVSNEELFDVKENDIMARFAQSYLRKPLSELDFINLLNELL